jgi:hypothetical protein
MVRLPEASVVKIDTSVSRTFLNSTSPKAVFYRLHQEMPSKQWSEWNGQSMSSSIMVVQPNSSIESLALSVFTPPPSRS